LNYNGSDSFTYKANDGTAGFERGDVAITVAGPHDAPVAANDSLKRDEDTALTIAALASSATTRTSTATR